MKPMTTENSAHPEQGSGRDFNRDPKDQPNAHINNQVRWAEFENASVPRDEIRMQVEIYRESILIRKFEDEASYIRMISADDIADAMAQHTKYESGMLPKDTLWWKKSNGAVITAIWQPPRVWPAALQTEAFKPPTRLRMPMPGLVFLCSPNRPPWIFAAVERPERPSEILFRAPAFNVFNDGRVCPGNHRFPDEAREIPGSFFQSFFSMTADHENRSRKHPSELWKLWQEIDGKEEYPIEDLVPQCTVADAMAIPESNRTRGENWQHPGF